MLINYTALFGASCIGTIAMTLFSYLVSVASGHNFIEPRPLGQLLLRLWPGVNRWWSIAVGWLLHYLVGVAFVTVYVIVWHTTPVYANLVNGAWMGFVSGVVGVAVWHLTFKVHPNPPVVPLVKYYLHLLAAHVVFGSFAAITYKAITTAFYL